MNKNQKTQTINRWRVLDFDHWDIGICLGFEIWDLEFQDLPLHI